MWLGPLWKRPGRALLPLQPCDNTGVVYEPERRLLPDKESDLILDFSASRIMRNKFIQFRNYSFYGIWSWQPQWNKTPPFPNYNLLSFQLASLKRPHRIALQVNGWPPNAVDNFSSIFYFPISKVHHHHHPLSFSFFSTWCKGKFPTYTSSELEEMECHVLSKLALIAEADKNSEWLGASDLTEMSFLTNKKENLKKLVHCRPMYSFLSIQSISF
jgi:hypothetical protein